jgi:hypothetical protein
MGRIDKIYAAQQNEAVSCELPTMQTLSVRQTLILGCSFTQAEECPFETYQTQTVWQQPVIGQAALPVAVYETEYRKTEKCSLHYNAKMAAALALLNCKRQLYAEFPDAVVEHEEIKNREEPGGILCRYRVIFTADIAQTGPRAQAVPSEDQ